MNPSAAPASFPSTLWSQVLAARDPASPAWRDHMNRLIERYWRPVYWTLRLRWRQDAQQAADYAQDFFVRLLDGQVVSTADPAKGSFRAYLRRGLEFFMLDALKSSYSQKRGGDRVRVPIDFGDGEAPAELADVSAAPESLFDRAWAHALMREAVDATLASLEKEGKGRQAEIFRALDLADNASTVRELAERFGVSKSEVWKLAADTRRRLREALLRRVQEYVTDETELYRELDELFSQ